MSSSRFNKPESKLETSYKLIAAVYLSGLENQQDLYNFLTHFDYPFIEKLKSACDVTLHEKDLSQ